MNTSVLKSLAFAAMLADHVAKAVPAVAQWEHRWLLLGVGRAAFALFVLAFVASATQRRPPAAPARHWALLWLALIAQPLYIHTFHYPWYSFNILFVFWAWSWLLSAASASNPHAPSLLHAAAQPLAARQALLAGAALAAIALASHHSSYGAWGLLMLALAVRWALHHPAQHPPLAAMCAVATLPGVQPTTAAQWLTAAVLGVLGYAYASAVAVVAARCPGHARGRRLGFALAYVAHLPVLTATQLFSH